jgi:hypothetical protein
MITLSIKNGKRISGHTKTDPDQKTDYQERPINEDSYRRGEEATGFVVTYNEYGKRSEFKLDSGIKPEDIPDYELTGDYEAIFKRNKFNPKDPKRRIIAPVLRYKKSEKDFGVVKEY